MHCRSQHCWELLHLFAHHCQHVRNNSQIVGATMLGVVASVCTQPNKENCHLKLYVFCLSCPSAAFALQPGGFVPRELLAAKGLLFLSQTQFIFCFLYNNCYIFFHKKNFEKLLKKPHRFHVFVAYINACLRDQFNMRHRVINKPRVVNFFFAYLKAAEHRYDAFLP